MGRRLQPAALGAALGLEYRAGQNEWVATRPPQLAGCAAAALGQRYALLLALNEAAARALPLVDLGRGDLALAAPTRRPNDISRGFYWCLRELVWCVLGLSRSFTIWSVVFGGGGSRLTRL